MKFGLSDVFWVIAIVAMACGWYVDRRVQSLAHVEDRSRWDKTTSAILHAWRELRAENAQLKMNYPPDPVRE